MPYGFIKSTPLPVMSKGKRRRKSLLPEFGRWCYMNIFTPLIFTIHFNIASNRRLCLQNFLTMIFCLTAAECIHSRFQSTILEKTIPVLLTPSPVVYVVLSQALKPYFRYSLCAAMLSSVVFTKSFFLPFRRQNSSENLTAKLPTPCF